MDGRARLRILDDLGGLELLEAYHPRPRFARHAHATFALGVVVAGVNRFSYRGAFHTATAGAICTVTPEEVHEVEPAAGIGFSYRCLYPRAELLRRAAESAGGCRITRTLALPPVIDDAATASLLAAVFDDAPSPANHLARETRLIALLTRVVARHALAPVAERPRTLPEKALARARDYLAERLAHPVTLAEVAAAVGLDEFALVRGFGRAYGLPPHTWLVQERVRRAKALLQRGRAPADVAVEVGFADQSHLTRHFKRLTGITPGCYQRGRTAG